jgi:hypothetical protein
MVQPAEVASSLVQRNKVVAKRKGMLATAAAGGAVAAFAIFSTPVIGVLGLAGAAYLGWDWFSFRVKNGMRF